MIDYSYYHKKLAVWHHQQKDSFIDEEIFRRLIDRLDFMNLNPKKILDVGGKMCATFQSKMKKRYSNSEQYVWHRTESVLQLQAFKEMDLIIVHLSLQGVEKFKAFFEVLKACLAPEGVLLFSTFGLDTLQEVRNAFSVIDDFEHVNLGIEMHNLGDVIQKVGLSHVVLDSEYLYLSYDSSSKGVCLALKDLRALNEPLAMQNRRLAYLGKVGYQKWSYQMQRSAELKFTYEIIYGHAIKGGPKKSNNNGNKKNRLIKVALEDIRHTNHTI